MDDWGQSQHRYPADLQYEDAQGVLAKLVGREPASVKFTTNLAENIVNAHATSVELFLSLEFGRGCRTRACLLMPI